MQIPKQPKSRQEILRQQQQSTFVGREEQIATFRYNLTLPPSDWCFLFNVWGQGGVGKSTLLRQFRKIATEASLITALTTDSETSIPEVMGRLADQLEQSGHKLALFGEWYKVYRQKKQELEADPEAPQGFSAFLGRSVAKAGLGLAKQIPGSGAVTPFLDEEMITTQASEWASYVAKKLGNKDEVRLVQEPVAVLTPLFLQDLSKLAEQANLLLLFDVYERTSGFLDGWLRDILEGRYGDLPIKLIFVIAGREPLDQNHWAEYEAAISRLPLDPFTEEEAKQYLIRKGIDNPQVIDVILRLSGCLPLLVATLASESPNDPARIGDPSGTAVERFLKWVDDPQRRQVALDAALPRVLNRDIIAVLHGEDSADDLFNWLREMPFVEEHSDGWAYHDIARTQMLRHKRLVSPQGWADLHGKLADYYEKLQTDLNLEQEKQYEDATSQQYALNTLYHRLCQSPQKHLPVALNKSLVILDSQGQFVQQWAITILQVGKNIEAEEAQRWGEQIAKGLKAYEEKHYEVAIEMLTNLLDHPGIETHSRAIALNWKGVIYRLMKRYEDSLKQFNQAIELIPTYKNAIVGRGYTYRSMKRGEEALKDFERVLELDPSSSEAVANRGYAYRLLKQYEEALKDFDRAIELNPKLTWALYLRGRTYRNFERYEDALNDLNLAIELDPNIPFSTILERGTTYLEMQRYEEALKDFNFATERNSNYAWAFIKRGETYRVMKCYEEAFKNFNRAIELDCKNDRAFKERGSTYFMLYRYSEALTNFNCAIELDQSNDWCFCNRALAHQALGQTDNAKADFERAIQLAQQKYNEKPKDFQNIFNLALYHLAAGNTERAKQFYRDALHRGAPIPRIREAIRDLETLLRVFPAHPLAKLVREALLKRVEHTT